MAEKRVILCEGVHDLSYFSLLLTVTLGNKDKTSSNCRKGS